MFSYPVKNNQKFFAKLVPLFEDIPTDK